MFEIIKKKMKEYIQKRSITDTEIRDDEMENITVRLSHMQNAIELISLINLNKLNIKVLTCVAPYFNLNIDTGDIGSELSDSSDNDT